MPTIVSFQTSVQMLHHPPKVSLHDVSWFRLPYLSLPLQSFSQEIKSASLQVSMTALDLTHSKSASVPNSSS